MAISDLIKRFLKIEMRAKRSLPITAMAPLEAIQTGAGTVIRDMRVGAYSDEFDGWVTNTGPLGTEKDYADEKYWIRRDIVKDGLPPNQSITFDGFTPPPEIDADGKATAVHIVTVTNSPELPGNANESTAPSFTASHYLRIGQQVRARAVYASDGTRHYVMNEPGPSQVAFYCPCTEDGTGADGTKTTAATWKYTVTLPNGTTKTSVDNIRPRKNGKTTKATAGWGAFTSAGTFVFDAFEKPTTVGC